MDPGTLNRQVVIQSPPVTQDANGQITGAWTTVATVWADVRHLGGLESIKSDADVSVVKASIRIRQRAGVAASMRVVAGATTYEIKAVLPDAARHWLDLVCEVVNASS